MELLRTALIILGGITAGALTGLTFLLIARSVRRGVGHGR